MNPSRRDTAETTRSSPVAAAKVSAAARRKAASRQTENGDPVHSLRTLLQDLGTLARNLVRVGNAPPFVMLTTPTALQQAALTALAVPLAT